MNPPRQAPVPIFEEAADTGATPCAEGMLAATLALMTGFAEHCARPEAARARPAVPRLLAAKAASNLFFLAGNPALSEPMRAKEQASLPENLPPYEPTLDLRDYKYPTLNLLETHGSEKIVQDTNELENHKDQIIGTLRNYAIEIQKISATVGPTVTLYEIVPAAGVRISKIKNLEDDIALSLAALGIRIIAPIPGKGTIGIEVPNVKKTVVSMKTLLSSEKFQHNNFSLPIAIGKKIDNENYIVDLASMPHLLMAGVTGQGKSVGLNAILVSLLYKKHPSQMKFVLIDPKKVELSIYRHIEKHFLAKLPGEEDAIITDTKKVVKSPDRQLFISITIMNMLIKMVSSIGLLLIYKIIYHPADGKFIIPFLIVYLLFTIFETYFMMRLADQKHK